MHASAFSAGLGLAEDALHADHGHCGFTWTFVNAAFPAASLMQAWQPLRLRIDCHCVKPLPAGGAAHITKDALWQHEEALHAGAMPTLSSTVPPEAEAPPDVSFSYIHNCKCCVPGELVLITACPVSSLQANDRRHSHSAAC